MARTSLRITTAPPRSPHPNSGPGVGPAVRLRVNRSATAATAMLVSHLKAGRARAHRPRRPGSTRPPRRWSIVSRAERCHKLSSLSSRHGPVHLARRARAALLGVASRTSKVAAPPPLPSEVDSRPWLRNVSQRFAMLSVRLDGLARALRTTSRAQGAASLR